MYVRVYDMYSVVMFARSITKKRADEAYALLKRKVFSWRQKDVSVNDNMKTHCLVVVEA